jgi:hypothetical protein
MCFVFVKGESAGRRGVVLQASGKMESLQEVETQAPLWLNLHT